MHDIRAIRENPQAYAAALSRRPTVDGASDIAAIMALDEKVRAAMVNGAIQLTVRGERLVTAIRRQPVTEVAVVEGKEAVKKAEQSATAARTAAKAGTKAAKGAAGKLG